MQRLQAKEHEEEEPVEAETSKGWNWIYTSIGVVASALVPIIMSLNLIQRLGDIVTLEMLLSVGVLVVLVVLLLALSARQRYNERVYLRAWQERQRRQKEQLREQQLESELFAEEARRKKSRHPEDEEGVDERSSTLEDRLLRSVGLETPS